MPLIEMAREPRLECPVVYLDRFPDGLVVDYARVRQREKRFGCFMASLENSTLISSERDFSSAS